MIHWTELWTVSTYLTLSMSWMYCCSSQPTRARSFLSSCCSTIAGTQPSKNLVTNMPALRGRQAAWVEAEGQANTWGEKWQRNTSHDLLGLGLVLFIKLCVNRQTRLQLCTVKTEVVVFLKNIFRNSMCRSGGSSVWGLLPNLTQLILLHFPPQKEGLLLKNILTQSNSQ